LFFISEPILDGEGGIEFSGKKEWMKGKGESLNLVGEQVNLLKTCGKKELEKFAKKSLCRFYEVIIESGLIARL